MPTKQIDRLLFAQGGRCFFCDSVLAQSDASVEHLVASAKGGSNSDGNCVVCCKAVNALLGSMSLKEKVRVVMNQQGRFKCPNGAGRKVAGTTATVPERSHSMEERLGMVIANLKLRGHSRPRRVETLKTTIAALFHTGLPESELKALVQRLVDTGSIVITDDSVSYAL